MTTQRFEELCSCVHDKRFWDSFSDSSISRNTLRYYLPRFCERVQYLIKAKCIPQYRVEGFISTMAIRKYRISCKMFYDIDSYSEVDKKNDGKHLSDVADCYEWIAKELGVPQETLDSIRLCVSAVYSKKILKGG